MEGAGGGEQKINTFFIFSARTSYSSKTSCSSGESSGGSESVFIVDSITGALLRRWVFSLCRGVLCKVPTRRALMTPPFPIVVGLGWAGVSRLPRGFIV